jgi:hypothetical protein
MHRFGLMISHEQLEALREIEKRIGVTPSEQMRRAIDTYLQRQKVLTKKEVARLLKDAE